MEKRPIKKTTKPELLSPVGNFTMLHAAINAGADAVFFSTDKLNMRQAANNFKLGDLQKVTSICHKNKVKAYLTLNSIIYDHELRLLEKITLAAKKAKVDAIICWDRSVVEAAKKAKIPIHLSTQASVSNAASAASYMKEYGVKRIVLARECSLKDIISIKKKLPKLEIETFCHGAMCISISGRCFMSQSTFGKSANRGECLQNCRREYTIKDKDREFELKVGSNYVMSPNDLCTLPFIDQLLDAKISSFKIEGRNRSPEYVKVVTESYRKAIDAHFEGKLTKKLKTQLVKKLKTVYNRGFSSGFFLGKPINEWANNYGSKATRKKQYIGKVTNFYSKVGVAEIKIDSGSLKVGQSIMIQGHKTGVVEEKITSIEVDKKKIQTAKKPESVGIKIKSKVRENDQVYVYT